ncbi:MAG: hypothetical protein M3473_02470 [Chloroflexota bacterium]|nr:hypothetical protein [Chloroflexota bacterium]
MVLTDLFGDVSFTDTNRLTVPPSAGTRHQTSFYAAAREAATSRLYGGIHYPMVSTSAWSRAPRSESSS